MAVRVRQVTRTTQPQEAAGIDWSNQITSGLVFAFDGNAWRDAVSGAVATPSGGPIRVSTTQGIATYFSGSAYLDFGDLDAWDVVGGLTVFWRGNFDATASPRRAVASKLSSDGTPFEFFVETFPRYIRRDATTYLDRYVGVAPTAGQIVTLGLMSDTDPHYANIAVDSVIAGAGDAGGGTCTAAAPTTGPLRLGRSYDGSDQLTGSINCCFVFNRRLSSDEYLTLLANPWQLFEPEQIVVKSGAAASGTTLTPGNLALTLTGYAPTVAQTANVALTPGVVALTLTGFSPTVTQTAGVTLTPGTATFTLTGYAPTVAQTANVTLTPSVLALTLTGYAPTVGQTTGLNLIPDTVALTTTGYAPTVAQTTNVFLTPSTLGLSLVGYAPTVTQTGVVVVTKGGAGKGSNLTLKQKKKLKAVVNQEWLKAEQTVQELLLERLGHTEPAKVRVEKLTQSQSLLDVIEALKALSKETVTLPEQQAVIKTINKTITEKTVKQVDRTTEIEKRMEAFEKRLVDLEEMVLVALSEIL